MSAGALMNGVANGYLGAQSILDARADREDRGQGDGTGTPPILDQQSAAPRSVQGALAAPSAPDASFDPSKFDGSFVSLIRETSDELQLPPEEVGKLMSYETAGTFDPMQKGPTTQHGQHQGLIQFGEPQAAQHGVDFSSREAAINSQLGKDGAIVRYALASGFKPGEHDGLDLYSTINAGAPGRYDASDENNGGAPGSVRDKYETQMAGHLAKARALLEHYPAEVQPQPPTAKPGTERSVVGALGEFGQLMGRFYKKG